MDLENNVLKGPVMGECFAPNYSNLFMGFGEETFVYSMLNVYLDEILWRGTYIGDMWSGSQTEQLVSYISKQYQ